MDDAENMNQAEVANHTLAYLRKLDGKIDGLTLQVHRVSEILVRHEERLGRIERDLSEIKSDLILMENQVLTRMTEIFHVTRRLDDHEERLEAMGSPPRPQA